MASDLPLPKQLLVHGWIKMDEQKMSKSLGNSLQVHEILKRVRGIELRWYLGSAHYRSMLEFSFDALEEAAVNFRRIEGFLKRATDILGEVPDGVISAAFTEAMNEDLAVPTALAVIAEILRTGNTALAADDRIAVKNAAAEIRGALSILGCDPFDEIFATGGSANEQVLDGLVSLALEQRAAARARKDFAAADAIRDQIAALGVVIEDTPQGTRWSIS